MHLLGGESNERATGVRSSPHEPGPNPRTGERFHHLSSSSRTRRWKLAIDRAYITAGIIPQAGRSQDRFRRGWQGSGSRHGCGSPRSSQNFSVDCCGDDLRWLERSGADITVYCLSTGAQQPAEHSLAAGPVEQPSDRG